MLVIQLRRATPRLLALLVFAGALGCQSGEPKPDPTALRTDYENLPALIDVMDMTITAIKENMAPRDWRLIKAFSENMRAYIDQLGMPQFRPQGRTDKDMQRYLDLVRAFGAAAHTMVYDSRLQKEMACDKDVAVLRQYLDRLRTYTGAPTEYEGEYYEERLEPTSLEAKASSR